jgi:hypothetical protein
MLRALRFLKVVRGSEGPEGPCKVLNDFIRPLGARPLYKGFKALKTHLKMHPSGSPHEGLEAVGFPKGFFKGPKGLLEQPPKCIEGPRVL